MTIGGIQVTEVQGVTMDHAATAGLVNVWFSIGENRP